MLVAKKVFLFWLLFCLLNFLWWWILNWSLFVWWWSYEVTIHLQVSDEHWTLLWLLVWVVEQVCTMYVSKEERVQQWDKLCMGRYTYYIQWNETTCIFIIFYLSPTFACNTVVLTFIFKLSCFCFYTRLWYNSGDDDWFGIRISVVPCKIVLFCESFFVLSIRGARGVIPLLYSWLLPNGSNIFMSVLVDWWIRKDNPSC